MTINFDVDTSLLIHNEDELHVPPVRLGQFRRDGNKLYCFRADCDTCPHNEHCNNSGLKKIKLGDIPNIRNIFLPHPGFKFVSIDYSGVEVRIAANMAQEKVWADAFLNGDDIHTATARAIFKREPSKADRKLAKGGTFCALFGGGSGTLARNVGISPAEAQEVFEVFFAGLSNLKLWMEQQRQFVRKHHFCQTYFGRKRDLEHFYTEKEYKRKAMMRSQAERIGLNHPIQGTAADIMKIAMVRVHKEILANNLQNDCKMLMTIHDELCFEVRTELMRDILPILVKAMTIDIKAWTVPLVVDVEVGDTWGKAAEFEWEDKKPVKQKEIVNTAKTTVVKTEPKNFEPVQYADLHLETSVLTKSVLNRIRKAIQKSPGNQTLRLHFKEGDDIKVAVLPENKVDMDLFMTNYLGV